MKINSSDNKVTILSIIIVNYNLAKEIEDCLNSILHNTFGNRNDYEIIIVDNNSPDKLLPETEKKYKKSNIHFYYLNENLGFGKGCNYGFSKSSGKYLCFLNPDTLVKDDIFSPIIDLLEKDKSVGIIGPKQQVKPPFFDFSAGFSPNIFFELFNLAGIGIFLEGFLVSACTKINKNREMEVRWILGASILIRADLFREVDGFDKDYFMFFEEVDLCKRVNNKGLKIIYYPKLAIHHIGSVSGKKDYALYTIRSYVSKNLFISKHYKSFGQFIFRTLLYTQFLSQIIIWFISFPINRQKSKHKVKAFVYLLKNKMEYSNGTVL